MLAFVPAQVSSSDIRIAVLLATLSIAYSVLTCRTERVRRALHIGTDPAKYRNLLACWTFTAAVILPLPLTVGVIAVSAIAEWPARNIIGQARPYRYIYSLAGVVLASAVAHVLSSNELPYRAEFLLAAPTYMAVGSLVVAAAMVAARQRDSLQAFLRLETYRYESATIAVGLAEVVLLHLQLEPLIWLSLPAAFGLQRWAVHADIRAAGGPFRPMGEDAWLIAATEIVNLLPVVSIVRINTAEPSAVASVAQIQAGCDAIGYAGASGLAMLLVDCPAVSADALATRLRSALRYRGVKASVAAASKNRDGYSLDDLLAVCEAELITREAADRGPKPSRPDA